MSTNFFNFFICIYTFALEKLNGYYQTRLTFYFEVFSYLNPFFFHSHNNIQALHFEFDDYYFSEKDYSSILIFSIPD